MINLEILKSINFRNFNLQQLWSLNPDVYFEIEYDALNPSENLTIKQRHRKSVFFIHRLPSRRPERRKTGKDHLPHQRQPRRSKRSDDRNN
jgi:hypothetical protein